MGSFSSVQPAFFSWGKARIRTPPGSWVLPIWHLPASQTASCPQCLHPSLPLARPLASWILLTHTLSLYHSSGPLLPLADLCCQSSSSLPGSVTSSRVTKGSPESVFLMAHLTLFPLFPSSPFLFSSPFLVLSHSPPLFLLLSLSLTSGPLY